jgi:hypothetical protein
MATGVAALIALLIIGFSGLVLERFFVGTAEEQFGSEIATPLLIVILLCLTSCYLGWRVWKSCKAITSQDSGAWMLNGFRCAEFNSVVDASGIGLPHSRSLEVWGASLFLDSPVAYFRLADF